VTNTDKVRWRYATISVSRYTASHQVSGIFDVTVDNGVQVSSSKTSFYGHGLVSLRDAIMVSLGELPWLESRKKRVQDEGVQEVARLENLVKKFHIVARQLRRRYNDRQTLIVKDEYDVQDLLHALLIIDFEDVRPEEYSPSYAGASSRIDFLLKKEQIVLEVKMASAKLKDKSIGEQLMVDMKRYQAHPDCRRLVCFVYDPDSCVRNPVALENDLSGEYNGIDVHVFVVPH